MVPSCCLLTKVDRPSPSGEALRCRRLSHTGYQSTCAHEYLFRPGESHRCRVTTGTCCRLHFRPYLGPCGCSQPQSPPDLGLLLLLLPHVVAAKTCCPVVRLWEGAHEEKEKCCVVHHRDSPMSSQHMTTGDYCRSAHARILPGCSQQEPSYHTVGMAEWEGLCGPGTGTGTLAGIRPRGLFSWALLSAGNPILPPTKYTQVSALNRKAKSLYSFGIQINLRNN